MTLHDYISKFNETQKKLAICSFSLNVIDEQIIKIYTQVLQALCYYVYSPINEENDDK